jgi:hypothetical protein
MSAGDFDFPPGSWRISHRTLKERLSGCQETSWVMEMTRTEETP